MEFGTKVGSSNYYEDNDLFKVKLIMSDIAAHHV